jgi:hypothetical protein
VPVVAVGLPLGSKVQVATGVPVVSVRARADPFWSWCYQVMVPASSLRSRGVPSGAFEPPGPGTYRLVESDALGHADDQHDKSP